MPHIRNWRNKVKRFSLNPENGYSNETGGSTQFKTKFKKNPIHVSNQYEVWVRVWAHPSKDSSPSTAAPSTIHCASVVRGSFFCTETSRQTGWISSHGLLNVSLNKKTVIRTWYKQHIHTVTKTAGDTEKNLLRNGINTLGPVVCIPAKTNTAASIILVVD